MASEKRFTLRMDADLFNDIFTAAVKNRRSTAKEIERAVAFYLMEMFQMKTALSIDIDAVTPEQAQEILRKVLAIHGKYDAFLE